MKQIRPNFFLRIIALFSASLTAGAADFSKDIQPIFARHCFECHGPQKQKGKLRLDEKSSVMRTGKGNVVVPKNAADSELYRRIMLPKGHEDIMPNRGEPLSKTETDLVRDWINEGAIWPDNMVSAKHWAYIKPVRPNLPETKNPSWAKNPIDNFILARLEKENLKPSSEAERARLLRRVFLDLVGLPPSPQEAEAFLADKSPDAYEKVVDRLLASPHYGERWARPWLDLARYADSSGFQRDDVWDLWPYRDWVIKALNADMPFDQFSVEQLAGDLLPDATVDQKIATGFNRATPTNVEAGSDQEETRVNQVFDRVNTLGTVWLASTIECAQCHNHKYDPISQKEYYQLFAFFNNTAQETAFSTKAMTGLNFTGPYLPLPDKKIEAEQAALQKQIEEEDEKIKITSAKLLAEQKAWETKMSSELAAMSQTHVLEIADFDAESDSVYKMLGDKSVLLQSDENAEPVQRDIYTITTRTRLKGITGFKLETLTDPSLPGSEPGRGDEKNPNFVLTDFAVKFADAAKSATAAQPIKLRNPRASFAQKKFAVAGAIDSDPKTGWAINPQFFKDHWAVFETTTQLDFADEATLTFTLAQNYGGGRTIGRLRLSALTGKPDSAAVPVDIATIFGTPAEKRTKQQETRLKNFYLNEQPALAKMNTERAKLAGELKKLKPPQTLSMQEMEKPRMSSMFVRGNFLEKGEPVQADVPAVLHPFFDETRNRLTLARWLVSTNNPLVARAAVNRWWSEFFGHGLVATPEDFGIKGDSPTHPELLDWLAMEFMEPTVRQGRARHSVRAAISPSLPSDGGEGRGEEGRSRAISPLLNPLPTHASRGEEEESQPGSSRGDEALTKKSKINQSLLTSSPTKPWSMKHIHRLIVTSATYRQSSSVSSELLEKDDQNKLYARGPRFRMDAEMIRDNALSASGLLSQKFGGPPVKPFQPPGIWESKVGGTRVNYDVSEGEDRYRRGLYTVWKRTSPYPSFVTFDASTRNACTVKRTRSNTPLQALTLLNDPVYVEAAKALAKRVLTEKSSAQVTEKIRHAFTLCTARTPTARETETLLRLYNEQLQMSKNDVGTAEKLFADFQKPEDVTAAEFAAWYSVASALLNLDETITKG